MKLMLDQAAAAEEAAAAAAAGGSTPNTEWPGQRRRGLAEEARGLLLRAGRQYKAVLEADPQQVGWLGTAMAGPTHVSSPTTMPSACSLCWRHPQPPNNNNPTGPGCYSPRPSTSILPKISPLHHHPTPLQARAFVNWGRALCLRAELARQAGDAAAAADLFGRAGDKFDAALDLEPQSLQAMRLAGMALLDAAVSTADAAAAAAEEAAAEAGGGRGGGGGAGPEGAAAARELLQDARPYLQVG